MHGAKQSGYLSEKCSDCNAPCALHMYGRDNGIRPSCAACLLDHSPQYHYDLPSFAMYRETKDYVDGNLTPMDLGCVNYLRKQT